MYNHGSKIIAHLSEADNLVSGELEFPITCEIDPSNYCQNNCSWCIYSNYIKSNRMHLDYSLYFDIILQLKEIGCKSITLTGGGEPLMNPEIVNMIKFAHSYGMKIGLITNGILLDTIIPQISSFEFIRVSLDATTSETYEKTKGTKFFNKVCENVKLVSKLGVTDIGISMCYGKDNEHEADSFPALGRELGAAYAQVKPLVDSNVETSSETILKISDAYVTERYLVDGLLPCKLAGLIGQVGADGGYYFCCIHRGNKKYKLADLRETKITKAVEDRIAFLPDLSDCYSCRYMNYAKEYTKVAGSQYKVLRHIDFL